MIDLEASGTAQDRGWGPGWPNGQRSQMVDVVWINGTSPAGGIRHEVADLMTILGNETIKRGYHPRAGWCWGYDNRPISGTTIPSNHSWGLAADINAPTNPRTAHLVTDMPSWMPNLWNTYGFRWGGDYTRALRDPMHYEFMGSPAQASQATQMARDVLVSQPKRSVRSDGDSMLVIHNDNGSLTYWLINGGKRVSVSAADAKTWSGPSLTIAGPKGWADLVATWP